MATPIQYIPQPIFSNVGVLQQQLAQDQQRHDEAMQNQLAMEDAFAQVPTHPTDIPIKNRVLGEFQTKVQDVVERYGGDYGAAAKDLTRLTSKTRQNPFFQLAPERRRLAEEERKARLQLGANYIPIKSAIGQPLQDPESGEWIDPAELTYDYEDRRRLQELIDEELGGLKTQTRESGLMGVSGRPEFLQSVTYRGIRPDEYDTVAGRMAEILKASNPELPDEIIGDVSSNYAQQYIQGQTISYQRDPLFGKEQPADPYGQPMPYFVSQQEVEDGPRPMTKTILDNTAELSAIQEDLNRLQTINASLSEERERGTSEENLANLRSQAKSLESKTSKKLNEASSELRKNVPLFKYLVDEKGIDPVKAANQVASLYEDAEATGYFGTEYYPTDDSLKGKFLREFTGSLSQDAEVFKQTEDGELEPVQKGMWWWKSNKPIGEVLTEKGINVLDTGFDFEDNQVILEVSEEGEGYQTYRIPFDGIKNKGVVESLKNFDAFTKAYTGIAEPGEYILGSQQRPSHILRVDYNDDTNEVTRNIYRVAGVKNGEPILDPRPVPIQDVMSQATTNLFDYYGTHPEYKSRKR